MPINNPIKTLRLHLGLSQGEFALLAKLSKARINQLENGHRSPLGTRHIDRILKRWPKECRALGVTFDAFVRPARRRRSA